MDHPHRIWYHTHLELVCVKQLFSLLLFSYGYCFHKLHRLISELQEFLLSLTSSLPIFEPDMVNAFHLLSRLFLCGHFSVVFRNISQRSDVNWWLQYSLDCQSGCFCSNSFWLICFDIQRIQITFSAHFNNNYYFSAVINVALDSTVKVFNFWL